MIQPHRKGDLNHQGHQEQRKTKLWKKNDGSIFVLAFLVNWVAFVVKWGFNER